MWQVLKRWQVIYDRKKEGFLSRPCTPAQFATAIKYFFGNYTKLDFNLFPYSREKELCLDARHLPQTKYQQQVLKLELGAFQQLWDLHKRKYPK